MFELINARGEHVNLRSDSIFASSPTGLGISFTNSYNRYDSYFSTSKVNVNQGQFQANIWFGDVESNTYNTFSNFATFLSYQPLTMVYTTGAETWYRDARVAAVNKSEIGGNNQDINILNESFTLDFVNPWYNNKTGTYRSYTLDTGLATFGKGFFNDLMNNQYNYIRHTSGGQTDGNVFPSIYGGIYNTAAAATSMVTPAGIKLTYTGDGNSEWYYAISEAYTDIMATQLKFNTPYTLSFDVMGTVPSVLLRVSDVKYDAKTLNNTTWTHVNYTFTMVDSTTNVGKFYIRINAANSDGATDSGFTKGQELQIRHLMLQDGSVDTGWAPAPEDNTSVAYRDYMYGYWGDHQEPDQPNDPYADEAQTDVTHL
ncbi:hypothetical protein D0501_05800 [Leuconostoc holzapfelii]|uniref:Distal tail protein N-terminal domain-containing protein n=1 Tax=Leuconostoc holzapfelii TaxID=434464 RepID=A0ABT2NZP0_9LACO|nr:phage distal tail protein domain-containing protein [Leuconostoc holzapfelii]MCT8389586.1 hypothetical protein [Leuconostoc holzapfelii]